ncbi:unnamed protein product [Pleuronectes platessa]|uniref:Uncharacterized protein n=1 Tax=Pleuronectes platessa TaxID=8262 RepID=A0A9N7U4C2_PLEPL|nr:unnamed protein product [Pleuronectes platessa]
MRRAGFSRRNQATLVETVLAEEEGTMAAIVGLHLPVMDHVPHSYQDDPTARAGDQVPLGVQVAGLGLRPHSPLLWNEVRWRKQNTAPCWRKDITAGAIFDQ